MKFNPMLTMGEFEKLSSEDKIAWKRQLEKAWHENYLNECTCDYVTDKTEHLDEIGVIEIDAGDLNI